MAEKGRSPPLAMIPVLERALLVLSRLWGLSGRCRFEIVVDIDGGGHVLEVWSHAEPPKLTRRELDRLEIPTD